MPGDTRCTEVLLPRTCAARDACSERLWSVAHTPSPGINSQLPTPVSVLLLPPAAAAATTIFGVPQSAGHRRAAQHRATHGHLLSHLELDQGRLGGAVCRVFGRGPPVAALPVHQEDLAARRLLLPHHAHCCTAACVGASWM